MLLVRGQKAVRFTPKRIYVASLFTWDWRPVWKAVAYYKTKFPKAELWLGGIYASLLPDHAKHSGADVVWEGLMSEADKLPPDYSLVPGWKSTLLFATRGCPRKCGFCSVPKLEGPPISNQGSIQDQIHPDHQKVVFFDNNVLALPEWRSIFRELAALQTPADFNQGMDVRLVTDEAAEAIARANIPIVRLAFDYSGIRPWVEQAIGRLKSAGVRGRRLVFYVLHNYIDDPQDFFERVRDLLSWGVVVYPMRYEPLCTLQKGQYIAPSWTAEQLQMVGRARRVMGYGGAFPPYKPLVDKFARARNFDEAFALRPMKGRHVIPQPLVEMALEHEQAESIRKSYFPSWRREKDWRKVAATTSSIGR